MTPHSRSHSLFSHRDRLGWTCLRPKLLDRRGNHWHQTHTALDVLATGPGRKNPANCERHAVRHFKGEQRRPDGHVLWLVAVAWLAARNECNVPICTQQTKSVPLAFSQHGATIRAGQLSTAQVPVDVMSKVRANVIGNGFTRLRGSLANLLGSCASEPRCIYYIYAHVCMCACMYVCMHECMRACMPVFAHFCIRTYMRT